MFCMMFKSQLGSWYLICLSVFSQFYSYGRILVPIKLATLAKATHLLFGKRIG